MNTTDYGLLSTLTVVYNPLYQYWTGIFLVLRCILFLVFVTSAFRNSSATGQVYKNWCVDVQEGASLLNLGILSVATSHNMMSGGNQELVANLSGGTFLILFLLVVVYHIFKQINSWNMYQVIGIKLRKMFHSAVARDDQQEQLLPPKLMKIDKNSLQSLPSSPFQKLINL